MEASPAAELGGRGATYPAAAAPTQTSSPAAVPPPRPWPQAWPTGLVPVDRPRWSLARSCRQPSARQCRTRRAPPETRRRQRARTRSHRAGASPTSPGRPTRAPRAENPSATGTARRREEEEGARSFPFGYAQGQDDSVDICHEPAGRHTSALPLPIARSSHRCPSRHGPSPGTAIRQRCCHR